MNDHSTRTHRKAVVMIRLRVWLGAAALCMFSSSLLAATIADSTADWSNTGTQGENNWSYGYYNLTGDADGEYQSTDFIAFLNDGSNSVQPDGLNHWTGGGWALYRDTAPNNTGPWTSIGNTGGHPNGTNSDPPPSVPGSVREEHWAIRRWESNFDGPVKLTSMLAATNTGGTGTTVHLFHNGSLLDTLQTNAAAGLMNDVNAIVAAGDFIDLALSPEAFDGSNRSDGADGSNFTLLIEDIPGGGAKPGDFNVDTVVDFLDFGIMADNFRETGASFFDGDINFDGEINLRDFVEFRAAFEAENAANAVPEPGSLLLLLFGAVTLLSLGGRHTSGTRRPRA